MNHLIQDLLDVARVEGGRMTIKPQRLSGAQVVAESVQAQEPLATAAALSLRMDLPADLPDIWVDREPIGSFDNSIDGEGRPKGNGDKPWVEHINQFTARVHVSGAMGASDVKVTFYAVSPPGVGDNGNWSPIAVKTIASIPQDGAKDAFCNWVPVVGKHT